MITANMTPPEKPPAILYRFFDENGLKTLVDGTLKLTPPREFNDPFEILPALPDKRDYSNDEIRKHFRASNGLARWVHRNRFPTEKTYNSWIESGVIPNRDLFFEHLLNLRDRFWAKQASEHYGVACFSDLNGSGSLNHDNDGVLSEKTIPMWSHYANDHKGMVIEFNCAQDQYHGWLHSIWVKKVKYKDARPICSLKDFSDTSPKFVRDRILRWGGIKSRSWGYEHEWRFIFLLRPSAPERSDPAKKMAAENLVQSFVQGERMLYLFKLWEKADGEDIKIAKANIIKRVILGARASEDLKASVTAALNQRHLQHVHLYEAKLDNHNFRLQLVLIRLGQSSGNN